MAINMVCSLDGRVAAEGKSGSIGSPTDRLLMRALRARADAVMVGAGTLRSEKLTLAVPDDMARERQERGLEPQPLAVIATGSGDVPLGESLLGAYPGNLVVFASSGTPDPQLSALFSRASVEFVPDGAARGPRLDLARALETLKKRYAVAALLVEGGPTLNHALVSAGLVDELFLTLAPKLLGGERPGALTILEGNALPAHTSRKPELISIHFSESELFLRYALRPI
ncbi:MAG: dihydrofolate reductase family protein [Actinomycetota bacterium]|nr:dihydrofolate reductase family protein [Actinomycetota bacterium]